MTLAKTGDQHFIDHLITVIDVTVNDAVFFGLSEIRNLLYNLKSIRTGHPDDRDCPLFQCGRDRTDRIIKHLSYFNPSDRHSQILEKNTGIIIRLMQVRALFIIIRREKV